MARWRADSTDFTVKVTRTARGHARVALPKPVLAELGDPSYIVFKMGWKAATIESAGPRGG